MKSVGMASCVAALLAASSFAGAALAGDAGPAQGSKLDQQINQAAGASASASSSDVEARIRDLESTRTELDQQKKPAVSLSVSGWVDQQVQYNIK
jgi:hypothetical protein